MASLASQPGGSGAAQLRREVLSFRIVELQMVAERLGLRKTGRKGDLQGRILAYFGDMDPASRTALECTAVRAPQQQWKVEQATKVVHDVYRRMMGLPASGTDQPAPSTQQNRTDPLAGLADPSEAALAAMDRALWGSQAGAAAAAAGLQQQQQQYENLRSCLLDLQQQQQQQQALGGSTVRTPGVGGGAGRGSKVRCICNVTSERGRMAMCQGHGCGVWQHCDCLGIQQGGQKRFLCELCRARLADPFWEVTEQVLPPAQLKSQGGRPPILTAGGMQQVQCADRVFYLNQQQLEDVSRSPGNHRVQVGCLLAGDEVPQRYHWPKHVDLRINSMPQRPYFRAQNVKMGINQRDDVVDIGAMVVRGRNSLTVSAADEGTWILTLQLARRRTLDQVKALMAPPESLPEAVARVRRQVGGGGGGGAGDSDDDLLVSHQVVSLKDPMSGQRMQTPARFAGASGLQAFDLDSLLSMAQRNRKWQDPTNLANSSVEQLQVDAYMQRVVDCLKASPGVTDVEISAEGEWRPDGSSSKYFDIYADPASVAAALASPEGPKTANLSDVGAPGGAASGRSGGGGGGSGAAAEELALEDSEEEDEAEELRKAAAAVKRTSPAPAPAAIPSQKRKQPDTEVIDLLSSEDDDALPASRPLLMLQRMAGVAAQRQQQQQVSPAAAAGAPLRIRLPMRARRTDQHRPAVGQPPQQQQQAWSTGGMLQQLQQQQLQQGAAAGAVGRAAIPLPYQPQREAGAGAGQALYVVPPGSMSASQMMDAGAHMLPVVVQPGDWAPAPLPAGPQAGLAAAAAAAAPAAQTGQHQAARGPHNAEAFDLFPWVNDEQELASLLGIEDDC